MTTDINTQVSTLKTLLPYLDASSIKFASSLILAHGKYGLSVKQAPWIGKLIVRAEAAKQPKLVPIVPEVTPINVGGFDGVVTLFTKAKEHLKFPKIVLALHGTPVVLSLAGPKSKVAGSINITGTGKYPNRVFYGRVSPEGKWTPSSYNLSPELATEMVSLLGKLAANPARVAKEYGILTGNCCFCNKGLTDPRSTAAGFGPVCAVHYGLKEKWDIAAVKLDAKVTKLVEGVTLPQPSELVPFGEGETISVEDYDAAIVAAEKMAASLEKLGNGFDELTKSAALAGGPKHFLTELSEQIAADEVKEQKLKDFMTESQAKKFSKEIHLDDEFALPESVQTATMKEELKAIDLSTKPGLQEAAVVAVTTCYLCESHAQPFTITHGLPVCKSCAKELEG